MTEPDPANYPWWLASRSAGIVAFLLIAASATLGLFMASGVYRRPGLKRDLLKVHQRPVGAALPALAQAQGHPSGSAVSPTGCLTPVRGGQ